MQLLLKYFRLNLLPSKVSHEKGVENPVKLTRSFNSLSTKITALSQPKTKGRSEVRQKGLFYFLCHSYMRQELAVWRTTRVKTLVVGCVIGD